MNSVLYSIQFINELIYSFGGLKGFGSGYTNIEGMGTRYMWTGSRWTYSHLLFVLTLCIHSLYFILSQHSVVNVHSVFSIYSVLNDFHHILEDHSSDFVLSYLLSHGVPECEVTECQILKRHFRDKNLQCQVPKTRNVLYFGYGGDSKEVNTQQMMDRIHCQFCHSVDTLECTEQELKEIENQFIALQTRTNHDSDGGMTDDDEGGNSPILKGQRDSLVDVNKIQLICVQSILKRKQKALCDLLGDDRFALQSTKYYTNNLGRKVQIEALHADDDETDEEVYGEEFDQRTYYWPKYEDTEYGDMYIRVKYGSLKEEVLQNFIINISAAQFDDVYQRSAELWQCVRGKRLFSYVGWDDMT